MRIQLIQPVCPYATLPSSLLLKLDAFFTPFVGIHSINTENMEDAQPEQFQFCT